ncbi:MAG: class I SAM-dependent methyltransferase [Gammaproteobacteria bacterium]|nr:class I SAM-dependent methyltransferase [Gammaproteobacteria bacterium]
MGCGFGATAKTFAKHYPDVQLDAISITPSQIEYAQSAMQYSYPHVDNVRFHCMDFEYTRFAPESFDGIYNIESACYGIGENKSELISEVHRLLKPGGKWVVHDVFNKKPPQSGNILFRWAYGWLCKGWAVDDYISKNAFEKELIKQGFCNIQFTNAFWQVLPSALHIPVVATKYLFRKIIFSRDFYRSKSLRRQRLLHFKASVCAPIVALHYNRFGYYIVSAEKKGK